MSKKSSILAICGSTRKASSNLTLIKAIAALANDTFDIDIYEGLSTLPHFDPDLDNEAVPESVKNFRHQLQVADGVLICTPEYALGVPGSLKNAIDWTVSSMDLSTKPTALITASLAGEKAHRSLLATLLIIESRMTEDTQLHIPFIKTKLDAAGNITDAAASEAVKKMINSLNELINHGDDKNISSPLLLNKGVHN